MHNEPCDASETPCLGGGQPTPPESQSEFKTQDNPESVLDLPDCSTPAKLQPQQADLGKENKCFDTKDASGDVIPPMPSKEAQRLLQAQSQTLHNILESIETEGPLNYRKRSCWAWYVWPTTKVGDCDPRSTACLDAVDVAFLLGCDYTRNTWAQILHGLAACLHTQQSRSLLPYIDHTRIDYFVKEWSDCDHTQVMKSYPQFEAALTEFIEAWRESGNKRRLMSYP